MDHLIVVPSYPEFDTKVRFLEHRRSAGGQTASAMAALSRLGMRTAYAGRFGSDSEGLFGFESLKREGVDVRFAEIIPEARNQVAFILIDARSGERTIIWNRDDRLAYGPEEAPEEFGSMGRVLHLDAHDPLACARLAREARSSGTITSADIDNIYPGLTELLPLIDVLISSRDFPARLTGIGDYKLALTEIKLRYGCPVVGMTLGAKGAMVYQDGIFQEAPGLLVPGGCRDSTGAGDAFHAGFIYGMLENCDTEMCLRYGCAVAALKCRELGARTGLPALEELETYLARGCGE